MIDEPYTKIFEFPVLWQGWELDETGWVAERPDGTRFLILTNHGGEYEYPVSELEEKLVLYRDAIAKTVEAISLLGVTK